METCSLCGVAQAQHTGPDIHHKFTLTDDLDLTPTAARQQKITRPDSKTTADHVLLKLLALLSAKGILDAQDLKLILGEAHGDSNTDRPSPE